MADCLLVELLTPGGCNFSCLELVWTLSPKQETKLSSFSLLLPKCTLLSSRSKEVHWVSRVLIRSQLVLEAPVSEFLLPNKAIASEAAGINEDPFLPTIKSGREPKTIIQPDCKITGNNLIVISKASAVNQCRC